MMPRQFSIVNRAWSIWSDSNSMAIFILSLQLRLRSIMTQNCHILLNLETGRIDWVQWLSTKAHWHQQNKGLQSLVSIIKSLIVSFFCRLSDLPGWCGRWIVKMCVPRFLFKTPCFTVNFDLLVQMKFWTIYFWWPWTLKLNLLETEFQAVCPLGGHLD